MTALHEAKQRLARVQELAAAGDISLARVEANALHEYALALTENTQESIAVLTLALKTRKIEGL